MREKSGGFRIPVGCLENLGKGEKEMKNEGGMTKHWAEVSGIVELVSAQVVNNDN